MEKETIPDVSLDKPLPLWLMTLIPFWAGGFFAIFLFPVAGDWRWLEGWAYTLTLAINMGASTAIINWKNPRVLRNRMKVKKEGLTRATRQSAGSDRFIMPVMSAGVFGALIIAALGHRFGWPAISLALEFVGLALSNAGLVIMNVAMLQNSFASKLLDINKGQVLVDTGLYARVRHPLYAGAALMILPIPVALGSWWGEIPAIVAVLALVARIQFEEEMLVRGMDGYREYQARVKYKLIPGIY